MKAIRMQNLRSLADTGFIELKPITLLLGQNSSGKSTFLRTFPLLRQSVETRTSGPILWYGDFVDFGDFQTAVGKYGKSNEITLEFKFQHVSFTQNMFTRNTIRSRPPVSPFVKLTLKLAKNDRGMTWVKECLINLFEHTIKIGIDANGMFFKLNINGTNFLELGYSFHLYPATKIVPYFSCKEDIYKQVFTQRQISFIELSKNKIPLIVDPPSSYLIRELIESIDIESSENMLHTIKNLSNFESEQEPRLKRRFSDMTQNWKEITYRWNVDTPEFQFMRDFVILHNAHRLLRDFDEYIIRYTKNTHYITPTRATAERYYRIQDLAVDEVDADGKNLAVFLWSLGEEKRQKFTIWTENVLGFAVSVKAEGGHISLMLKESDSEIEFNVADMGFGFSQLLPIVTQLWVSLDREKRSRISLPITFAIEQPELHLHPALQAKLADIFLAAIKTAKSRDIDLTLIIETHSKTIINRFGHRIARQEVNHDDINVVLFDKQSPNTPTEINIAYYDKEGGLTNWPFGFLEPDRI